MDQFLALIVGVLIFVPCAIYGWSAITRDRAADAEQEPQSQDVNAQPEPTTWTAEQTFTQKVTNVALTSIKKAIGVNIAPRALPRAGTDSDTTPSGAGEDSDDAEDLPGWEDADIVRPDPPADPPKAVARILRRALPWLRATDTPPVPEPVSPRPALDVDPPDLPPMTRNEPDVQVDAEVDRDGERPAERAVAVDDYPILTGTPAQVVTGPPMTVDPDPVALEGVDMSQAPLVPAGDGSVARVPTISQLRIALATGGFSRLKAWLRAFKKASGNTRDQANALHADALVIARRARTAHVMALQAFQAVQADKLDRQTINRVWQMLERTQAEAAAAANVTRWTAALVVAAGGAQPAVAAALSTLQRNHGGTAAAIQASPVDPVPNLDWYRN
jgi:hypothetical protein